MYSYKVDGQDNEEAATDEGFQLMIWLTNIVG